MESVMKIDKIEANKKVPNLVATIVKVQQPEESPSGLEVQEAIIEDDTGNTKLKLWKEMVGKFKEGDKISLRNGYCGEFEGNLFVTPGKYGKISKVSKEKVK